MVPEFCGAQEARTLYEGLSSSERALLLYLKTKQNKNTKTQKHLLFSWRKQRGSKNNLLKPELPSTPNLRHFLMSSYSPPLNSSSSLFSKKLRTGSAEFFHTHGKVLNLGTELNCITEKQLAQQSREDRKAEQYRMHTKHRIPNNSLKKNLLLPSVLPNKHCQGLFGPITSSGMLNKCPYHQGYHWCFLHSIIST